MSSVYIVERLSDQSVQKENIVARNALKRGAQYWETTFVNFAEGGLNLKRKCKNIVV